MLLDRCSEEAERICPCKVGVRVARDALTCLELLFLSLLCDYSIEREKSWLDVPTLEAGDELRLDLDRYLFEVRVIHCDLVPFCNDEDEVSASL